jgi:hypothetical protein
MADLSTDKRLKAIAAEIARLKESFNSKIEANTLAIETQSALMLVAVASLEDATDAVTAAVDTMNKDTEMRNAAQIRMTRDLCALRAIAVHYTNQDIDTTELEELTDGY